MRSFIAIEIEENIKNQVGDFIHQMKRWNAPVRWIDSQGIHLTLKFLGEISEAQAVEVSSILDSIFRHQAVFSLHIAGVGTFPVRSSHPRVIWAGISQEAPLSALQADLEQALLKAGFPSEKRIFNPHLTLGRVKSNQGIKPLVQALQDNALCVFGSMPVNRIILFKSNLMPSGAKYSQIHSVDLSL